MSDEKKRGMGLLPRLILGIFIPIVLAFLIIWCMIFYSAGIGEFRYRSIKEMGYNSLVELSALALKESTSSLNKLGEKAIQQRADNVAKELAIYIASQKKFVKTDMGKDTTLRAIAIQKVGETGYTAVFDSQAITYLHNDPKVEGMNMRTLETKLPDFWKIFEAGTKGVASGYYNWKDPDGRIRQKFMHVTPVKGTDLSVAATTYIDEFSKPSKAIVTKIKEIEDKYSTEYTKKFTIFYIIVAAVLFVLLLVLFLFAYSIIKPIHHLSEVADKISMGDLKTVVDVKATGEVGLLAESIERMQASVKAAIERLQRRRGGT